MGGKRCAGFRVRAKSGKSRTAAAGAAALALAGCGAALAFGEGGGPTASATPRAEVLTSSQRNALRLGYVRVRVTRAPRARSPGSAGAAGVRRAQLPHHTFAQGAPWRLRREDLQAAAHPLGPAHARLLPGAGDRREGPQAGRAVRGARTRGPARPAPVPGHRERRGRGRRLHRSAGGHLRAARGPAARRAQHRRRGPLRLPRSGAVPVPVPERPLHGGGPGHAHQAPAEHLLGVTPQSTKTLGRIDTTDQNRADGFSPGNLIVTKVPGLDSQEAFEQTGAVPITDMARTLRPRPAGRGDQRAHQEAPADLGGDRLEPAGDTTRRHEDVTLIIRPGQELRRGRALHRRAAADAQGRRLADSPARGVPRLSRRASPPPTRTSRRGGRSSRASSRPSARPASPARTCT